MTKEQKDKIWHYLVLLGVGVYLFALAVLVFLWLS